MEDIIIVLSVFSLAMFAILASVLTRNQKDGSEFEQYLNDIQVEHHGQPHVPKSWY